MKMEPVLVHLPSPVKAQLDALRAQGYTASGFIRAALVRALAEVPEAPRLIPPPRRKRATLTRK